MHPTKCNCVTQRHHLKTRCGHKFALTIQPWHRLTVLLLRYLSLYVQLSGGITNTLVSQDAVLQQTFNSISVGVSKFQIIIHTINKRTPIL